MLERSRDAEALEALGSLPLPQLTELRVAPQLAAAAYISNMCANTSLASLEVLVARNGYIPRSALRRLAGTERIAKSLRRLELPHNRYTLADPSAAAALAAAPFERLTALDIAGCRLSGAGLLHLAAAPWLPRLERLNVGYISDFSGDDEAPWRALATAPLHALRVLNFDAMEPANPQAAAVLAAAPWLPRLRRLMWRPRNGSFSPLEQQDFSRAKMLAAMRKAPGFRELERAGRVILTFDARA